jgi:hypothetical protein
MPVTIRYTVRGFSQFPEDMLRYDRSGPATDEDTIWIEAKGLRELMLKTEVKAGVLEAKRLVREGLIPCRNRWASFLWNVTEVWVNDESVYAPLLEEDTKRGLGVSAPDRSSREV